MHFKYTNEFCISYGFGINRSMKYPQPSTPNKKCGMTDFSSLKTLRLNIQFFQPSGIDKCFGS